MFACTRNVYMDVGMYMCVYMYSSDSLNVIFSECPRTERVKFWYCQGRRLSKWYKFILLKNSYHNLSLLLGASKS